jgi:hypothetical protein
MADFGRFYKLSSTRNVTKYLKISRPLLSGRKGQRAGRNRFFYQDPVLCNLVVFCEHERVCNFVSDLPVLWVYGEPPCRSGRKPGPRGGQPHGGPILQAAARGGGDSGGGQLWPRHLPHPRLHQHHAQVAYLLIKLRP